MNYYKTKNWDLIILVSFIQLLVGLSKIEFDFTQT